MSTCVLMYVGGHTHPCRALRWSGDSFQESVLSFYPVDSGIEIRPSGTFAHRVPHWPWGDASTGAHSSYHPPVFKQAHDVLPRTIERNPKAVKKPPAHLVWALGTIPFLFVSLFSSSLHSRLGSFTHQAFLIAVPRLLHVPYQLSINFFFFFGLKVNSSILGKPSLSNPIFHSQRFWSD